MESESNGNSEISAGKLTEIEPLVLLLCGAINLCRKIGETTQLPITDAFDCFVEMEGWGISPNAVTYNSLIHSFCKAGDVARAMKLFRKMQIDQIQPDVYAFNALILKYCKVNKIGMARRLLSRMLAIDLKPDNFTYIAFINTFCESGRLSEAKKLLCSMEANGCSPDAHTCHSVIWLKYKGRGIELQPMPAKSVTFVCDFDAEEIASST